MKARRNPSGLFSAPESIQEQKARLARELAQLKMREDREKLATRAGRKLVGSRGDIGQADMFGGGDLFSRKNPRKKHMKKRTKRKRSGGLKKVRVTETRSIVKTNPRRRKRRFIIRPSHYGGKWIAESPTGITTQHNSKLEAYRYVKRSGGVATYAQRLNPRKCVVRHKVKCSRRGKCRVKHAVRCNPRMKNKAARRAKSDAYERRRKTHRKASASYVAIRAGGRYQLCRVSGGSLKRMGMFKRKNLVKWCKAHGVKCR